MGQKPRGFRTKGKGKNRVVYPLSPSTRGQSSTFKLSAKAEPFLHVGQIFYASWGYDQTNIDFVQVVSVSKTGKTVICRRLGSKRIDASHVIPTEPYGKPFRLKVKKGKEISAIKESVASTFQAIWLRGSYPFAGDSMRMDSFSVYHRPVYETPIGLGH